jgi:hypothetical protein
MIKRQGKGQSDPQRGRSQSTPDHQGAWRDNAGRAARGGRYQED